MRNRNGVVALAASMILLAFLVPAETLQAAQCPPSNAVWWGGTGAPSGSPGNNCQGVTGYRCYPFQKRGDWFVRMVVPTCDPEAGDCDVELVVPLTFPGAGAMYLEDGSGAPLPVIAWFDEAVASVCGNGPPLPPTCNPNDSIGQCGWAALGAVIGEDEIETWVEIGALSCADLPSSPLAFSLEVRPCPLGCTQHTRPINNLIVASPAFSRAMGCSQPEPPPTGCGEGSTGGGAACCLGPSGASPATGGGPGFTAAGHGAALTYQAGGVGTAGLPGSAAWRPALGRNWSHEYAERIVLDPDVGTDATVWLLTKWGTFRKFTDLSDGVYGTAAPSDEYRTLRRTGSGWELEDLQGTVSLFDSSGLWQSTTDRNGNAYVGSYTGALLTLVTFPDGRSETFGYTSGRLSTITQVGRGASPPTRTWTLTWSVDDLVRIQRPDGTAWRFEYGDILNPGFVTREFLVSTTGSERVEGAWEYDMWGNVTRTWKGATTFESGVDNWQLSYDDPEDPTVTTITDPLGVVSTRTYERDAASRKPRVTEVSGSCSVCGSSPETTWDYEDANHPLLPTTITDGEGNETVMTYSGHGQPTSRTDAANETSHPHLPRITEWEYDADFPGFVTRIEGPTGASDPPTRIVTMSYDDTTGDLDGRTIEGDEATYAGGSFTLGTSYVYNGAGRVLTIDPPGYVTADATQYTYNVPGANGMLPDTRTDPLVGTWEFEYDPFNRRVREKDLNGAVTDTQYDALDRPTLVIQREDDASDPADPPSGSDLATRHFYSVFGDLFCVKTPAGAGMQFVYDSAGRLTEQIRGTAVASPTSTSCLVTSQLRERAFYTLDDASHRTLEVLQRTTTSSFPNPATTFDRSTAREYSTLCHLDKVIEAPGAAEEAVTEYAYDCRGNLENVWDANHPRASYPSQPSTTYAYDALNRLETVTQPWGGSGGGSVTTSYEYDVQDHLVEVTDGEGTVTSYVYSDRDLMTSQTSEVSGTTTYSYNDHAQLESETDELSVTVSRTVDAADRVTQVDYPGSDLDVTYTWGTSAANCEVNRLIGVTRDSETVDHTYDCFGRMLQDGELAYTYNADGDRLTMSYPGSLVATYTYDRMRRPISLSISENGGTPQVVVLSNPAATYKPFGPLASLRFDLTTDRNEVRAYNLRYAPTSIRLQATSGNPPAQLFGWDYSTDAVGNVMSISQTQPSSVSRSYDYQEWQQYLVEANGPWGVRIWDYDRVGNRVTEDWQPWSYEPNDAASGNTTEIISASLGFSGANNYSFDAAGDLAQFAAWRFGFLQGQLDFTFDDAGQLSYLDHSKNKDSTLRYDGRGFLAGVLDGTGVDLYLTPTYSSAGVLHSLLRTMPSQTAERTNVLYFAGRPIAIWKKVGTGTATLTRVVTDHLGTPAASIQQAGTAVDWYGGFEPFGRDWQENTLQDSLSKGIFLRMPGQWKDATWSATASPMELLYNVHRWYETGTGRYTTPDPLGLETFLNLYTYVDSRPTLLVDPDGRQALPGGSLPWAVPCVLAVRDAVRSHASGQTRYQHCLGNCLISQNCPGGGITALAASLAKEVSDIKKCLKTRSGGSCDSAWQPQDFEDNQRGRECRPPKSCGEGCSPLLGEAEPPPGPFAGFGGPSGGGSGGGF